MAKGGRRPGAGRPKGTPNKITAQAKAVFLALFDNLAPEIEGWIRETAQGVEVIKTDKEGNETKLRQGADPGKAADLAIRLAEYHYPKLGRSEITGTDGGPVVVEIVKYGGSE